MMIPLLEKARLLSLTETEQEILDYLEKNITAVTALHLQCHHCAFLSKAGAKRLP